MFNKMRQPTLTGGEVLVTTTGIDGKAAMSHGATFKMQMHYAQSVIEGMVCRFDHDFL